MSGLATNFFESIDTIKKMNKQDQSFSPSMSEKKRNKLYKNWKKAVFATREFK